MLLDVGEGGAPQGVEAVVVAVAVAVEAVDVHGTDTVGRAEVGDVAAVGTAALPADTGASSVPATDTAGIDDTLGVTDDAGVALAKEVAAAAADRRDDAADVGACEEEGAAAAGTATSVFNPDDAMSSAMCSMVTFSSRSRSCGQQPLSNRSSRSSSPGQGARNDEERRSSTDGRRAGSWSMHHLMKSTTAGTLMHCNEPGRTPRVTFL